MLSIFFFIMAGTILQGTMPTQGGACPLYCLDVGYMTCPSSGLQRLPGKCNCCLAPKGCTLHLRDGSLLHCN
ncbi:hypothetical protein AMTRI_Chr04g248120 [Amborella trichopoda]